MLPQEPNPQAQDGAQPPAGAPQQLDQSMLQRVVMAGQRLMYNEKTSHYFTNALRKEGNPVEILPVEIVGLLKLLDDKQKGKLPRQVLPSAAVALLVEAAHFAAEAGIFVMKKEEIAVAAQATIKLVLQAFGSAGAKGQPQPAGIINQSQGGM